VESSSTNDGRVNRWEHYSGDVRIRAEEDTDGDGRADRWERYLNGALTDIALDTSATGVPDRRLIYRADGELDRLELLRPDTPTPYHLASPAPTHDGAH
jgi:hypothetical protein